MSTLPVKDIKGESTGQYEIPDELLVFDKGSQSMHHAVVSAQNARRTGNAATLSKGEVAGTTSKPWRQKGTGRARAGYRQSPVWRGGAVAFGPKPRSYEQKISKKAARLAFCRAFSEKVAAGQVLLVEDMTLEAPKTRGFIAVLENLEADQGALFVVETAERNLTLASRNVPATEVETAENVSTYQLVRYPLVVITRAGMKKVEGRLKRSKGKSS